MYVWYSSGSGVCVVYIAVAVVACDVVVAEVWCGSNSGACVW